MGRTRFAAAALLLLPLGCQGSDDTAGPAVTVRDSAGVEIVENGGDPWSAPTRWRLSAEPVLRIGAVEGEAPYLFDRIRGIVALRDGRVVVANSGDQSLRWFDAEGRFLFQRGGAGEGPGEFARLGGITRAPGDSLVAVDVSGRRFSVFGPDGEHGGTRRIAGLAAPPGDVHRVSDGTWIAGTGGSSTAQLGDVFEPGVYRFDSPILHLSRDAARIDTLGLFPASEMEIRRVGDDRFAFGPARLARSLSYAVSDDRIYVGTADRLEVDVFTAAGRKLRSVRAPEVDVRVTDEVDRAYREFLRARYADATPEQRAAAERTISEIELPPTMPAYETILTDDRGNLWIGEYRFDLEPPRQYIVFDAAGRFVTGVSVPAGLRVMAIASDRVWGRVTDELGVEYVVAYALTRG